MESDGLRSYGLIINLAPRKKWAELSRLLRVTFTSAESAYWICHHAGVTSRVQKLLPVQHIKNKNKKRVFTIDRYLPWYLLVN